MRNSPVTLCCLAEQPDVFIDAMAADHRDLLLFASVYGRDTSVQQLLARLHQSSREGGVESLTVDAGNRLTPPMVVPVGDARRLDKVTGRMPRTGLLGNLVHCWIFDPAMLDVDHAGRSAWIVEHQPPPSADNPEASGGLAASDPCQRHQRQVWALVRELSPVPMLDAWRDPVLSYLSRNSGFQTPPCFGPLDVLRIGLPESFADWVSDGVRHGLLAV